MNMMFELSDNNIGLSSIVALPVLFALSSLKLYRLQVSDFLVSHDNNNNSESAAPILTAMLDHSIAWNRAHGTWNMAHGNLARGTWHSIRTSPAGMCFRNMGRATGKSLNACGWCLFHCTARSYDPKLQCFELMVSSPKSKHIELLS